MGIIYSGISWILLTWHTVWHAILPERAFLSTNWDWILAIVFLVLTVRGVLFPVFVKQIKSQRAMQAIQPQIKALQEKHKGDRAGLQAAQMELMRKENANPLMGCLPMLVQIPVFLGLFHVLRHLKPSMPVGKQSLYGWTVDQFHSASDAKLFGAPIAASMRSSTSDLVAMHATALNVRLVAGLLIAIMIVTTYLTSRQMILKTGWATDPTQLMVQRLMMYGVPISLLISGTLFPIGVVIYWVTTNLFSLGQQFYVLRKFPPPVAVTTGATGTSTRPVINGKVVPDRGKAILDRGRAFLGRGGAISDNGRVVPDKGRAIPGKGLDKGKAVPDKGGAASGKAAPAKAASAKATSDKSKSKTNGTPVPQVRAVGPKPGAKPVNPKKGNAPKRLSS